MRFLKEFEHYNLGNEITIMDFDIFSRETVKT